MARPQSPRGVTVLGECVADAFVDPAGSRPGELALRALPGGGPANTAVALARLGTPTRFLGRFSGDAFGTLFRARLAASGVDLTGSVAASEASTLAVADLDETGQATYTFYADSAADWQWTADELAATRQHDAVCLHTGSLALIRQPGGRHIEDHLAQTREHATVSIDPNVRPLLVPPATYRERLPRWCALADILRLSEDDLALLLPGAGPEQACDTWHAAGVRLVVITLGGRGAVASLDGVRVTVPAPAVDVVDTVGAGDSFTAGLLHRLAVLGHLGGRLDGLSLDDITDACSFAARVSALTCSVPGANPPRADEAAPEGDVRLLLPHA
ncbi:carbohydrate kinase [Streptomyces sp. NPDC006235]|uniref:carbohydrate kinase family protein n=1 Tax=Streptomyces sp. NPDC006235 TaxID=3156736 RepID=UPI0033A25111